MLVTCNTDERGPAAATIVLAFSSFLINQKYIICYNLYYGGDADLIENIKENDNIHFLLRPPKMQKLETH